MTEENVPETVVRDRSHELSESDFSNIDILDEDERDSGEAKAAIAGLQQAKER